MAYEVSARRTELSIPTEAQQKMRVARHCRQFCWSTRRKTLPLAKSAQGYGTLLSLAAQSCSNTLGERPWHWVATCLGFPNSALVVTTGP